MAGGDEEPGVGISFGLNFCFHFLLVDRRKNCFSFYIYLGVFFFFCFFFLLLGLGGGFWRILGGLFFIFSFWDLWCFFLHIFIYIFWYKLSVYPTPLL